MEQDTEDVSEEACIGRHDRSEVEERKKFMSYLKQPPGASRGRRRVDHVDSRAESSGANTPDPMSPIDGSKCGSDRLDAGDPCADETDLMTDAGSQFSVSAVKERRRTASLTKKADNVFRFYDDNSAMSWEMDEVTHRRYLDISTLIMRLSINSKLGNSNYFHSKHCSL